MKKKLMVGGLLPALVLSTCGVVGAQQPAAMDALTAMEQNPDTVNQAKAANEPVTQESLQEMRRQLEEQLQQAQELQNRLNAQLGSLEKRMKKVEKRSWEPQVDIHGYGRLRWDKHNFSDFNGTDRKSVWLNLFVNHRINDRWSLHSEHEFENDLSSNTGAYKEHGKSRPVLQLYAQGRVGDVNVKLGRFYLQSPYKFTYDEKVNGWQVNYGIPTKWGRKAEFTLSSGVSTSQTFHGDTENTKNVWDQYYENTQMLSLMGVIPVAKNTNISAHYGRMTMRDIHLERKTWSVGFDTKLNRDLKLTAGIAKSDSETLNKSHFIQLQYKEARPDVPGSYDFYIKKYLQRGHTGMSNWFNDDIVDVTRGDDTPQLDEKSNGLNRWDYRAGEFNGIRIGLDYVPVRNTKLLLHYTYGKLGIFDPDNHGGNHDGEKKDYSFLRTQLEMYF